MGSLSVGDVVDSVDIVVERGKVREFARASATADPVHRDAAAAAAAGFTSIPATLTHTVVTGHVRDQRGFVAALGLTMERIVVGSVSWEYARPLLAGDELHAERRVESDERKEGRSGPMRIVTLVTTFTDSSGSIAAVQRETLIERAASA